MLTGREHEILQLVAHGLRTRAIAVQLGIAEVTVVTFIRSARLKLGARNRVQAAALAVDPPANGAATALAPEQRRLLALLGAGSTVDEAARCLHMSRRTAQRRLAEIRRRLSVPTTAAAVAQSVGLGDAEAELARGSPDAVAVRGEEPDREGR